MAIVSFECGLCLEESQSEHTVRTIADNPICSQCLPQILNLFREALKNEINFPPRWGPEEISFESFEDLFSDEFCLAYREKTREYTTPIPKRVYCQHKISTDSGTDSCNSFMGSVEAKGISQCSGCKNWMHFECRNIALPPPATHTCDHTKASESEDFDPATKNKEWTSCPNPDCGIKIALKDGCNAITCPCSTEFCVLCGEIAGHDSNHWTEGKPCPRWGAVDAPNPMFDEAPIVVLPGFPVIMIPLGAVPNPRNARIGFAVNDRLHLDSEEALTVVEELSSEQFWMTDDEGNVDKAILDIKELFRMFHRNLEWLKIDLAVSLTDPQIRPLIVDSVDQAIETTNFFIRDEILQARLREMHAAALQISGEDSVLFTVPVIEIFERYNTMHKPKLVERVRQFVAARDAGRALWADREGLFARAMRRRQEGEDEDEEDLPHRRASI